MAVRGWNVVTVPFPGCQCTVTVSSGSQTATDGCIQVLIPACQKVGTLLGSRVLTAELEVLSSLLFVFRHKLRQHKPYLALKQVEQCVKRLNNMRLETSVCDLIEFCQRTCKIKKADTKRVPSQPVLEWTSLKVLGGCKLMLRLMDMCSKAFQLAIKHLHWQEFIVLNLIVTGLLSRLWVLSRGILQSLVVLYDKLYLLLKKVETIQQMPYLKDFTLPTNIQEWLGAPYSKIMQEKYISLQLKKIAARKPDLLNKLFSVETVEARGASAPARKRHCGASFKVKPMVDIGCPVQNRRAAVVTGMWSGPDKTSLQTHSHTFPQNTKKSQTKSKNEELEQLSTEAFVRKIKATQTFKVLSQELKGIFLWFRNRNLRRESHYLGNQHLRSNRRGMLEAQGYSFEKKLQDTKIAVCRYLVKWSQATHLQSKVLKKRRRKVTVQQDHKMRHKNLPKLSQVMPVERKHSLKKKSIMLRSHRKKRKESQKVVPPTPRTVQTEAKRESVAQHLSAESVANVQDPKFSTLLPGSAEEVDGIVRAAPKLDNDIDDIFSLIGV